MDTKYRPILFSSEMIRAILDGRKTQTRRVINPMSSANRCPYGYRGDMLWVRETWASHKHMDDTAPSEFSLGAQMLPIFYRANYGSALSGDCGKWRPSIHMPRWASRLTLRVVNVRVERVQKISKADAIAEGICPFLVNYGKTTNKAKFWRVNESDDGGYQNPTEAFENLWDSINAKRGYSWDSNPWVWVVEFEVVK